MQFFKRIDPGAMIPTWYGACWWDWARNQLICCPLPLNLVLRPARLVWQWLHFPWRGWFARDAMEWKIRELERENRLLRSAAEGRAMGRVMGSSPVTASRQ